VDVRTWLPFYKEKPSARLRLFCFPFAGGGAGAYRAWQAALPPEVDVCAVGLPGRESRFTEPPFTSVAPLVAALSTALTPLMSRPFAFFGHSLGGLIAFELTQQLRRQGRPLPIHFFASAAPAPSLVHRQPKLGRLPQPELIAKLRQYNGTPKEVLEHATLMELLLPTLRADFMMIDDYSHQPSEPLPIAATVIGGSQDAGVPESSLEAWSEAFTAPPKRLVLPGDHFFIQQQQQAVLSLIASALK
jgi:medium-chain acyl-[acyl-carrier-protein] hydrolase